MNFLFQMKKKKKNLSYSTWPEEIHFFSKIKFLPKNLTLRNSALPDFYRLNYQQFLKFHWISHLTFLLLLESIFTKMSGTEKKYLKVFPSS